MMYDIDGKTSCEQCIDPFDQTRIQVPKDNMAYKDLLIPVMRNGKRVYPSPSLERIRQKTFQELSKFPPAMRHLLHPESYFVGLEKNLHNLKLNLIQNLKESK